uniref:GAG-pre-integrase domain-containing protein n=1 Tax=Cannabis sativa TaxID=3483 RepID=A0A803NFL6_CANSA
MKLCRGLMVVMRRRKSNGIYPLEGITVKNKKACVSNKHVNETEEWHKRLGHVSERGLHELNKVKFGTGKRDTKGALVYVHSDLWESSKALSHFGSRAMSTTTYLINKCPSTTLDFKTLDEVWDVTFNESVMGFIDKPARSQANTDRDEIKAPGTEHEVEPPRKMETEAPIDHKSDDSKDDSKSHNLKSYKLARDRTQREVKAPNRYEHADLIAFTFHVANQIVHEEPTSYAQEMKNKDQKKWNGAMSEEMHSLKKNQT